MLRLCDSHAMVESDTSLSTSSDRLLEGIPLTIDKIGLVCSTTEQLSRATDRSETFPKYDSNEERNALGIESSFQN